MYAADAKSGETNASKLRGFYFWLIKTGASDDSFLSQSRSVVTQNQLYQLILN